MNLNLQRISFFCLLAFVTSLNAQTWVPLPESKAPDHLILYDQDSIHQAPDGAVSITWKEANRGLGSFPLVVHGSIDCIDLSITTTEFSIVNPILELQQRFKPAVEAGRQDVAKLDPVLQTQFPNQASPAGQLIHKICADFHASRDNVLINLAMTARVSILQCSRVTPSQVSALCSNELEMNKTLGLVMFRLAQMANACKISSVDLGDVLTPVLLGEVPGRPRCDGNLNCHLSMLDQYAAEMGEDLSNYKAGKQCEKFAMRHKLASDEKHRHAATTRFWACVKDHVSILDDQLSPADTIATGLISACRQTMTIPEFRYLLDDPALFDQTVRPGVITNVLEHRSKKSPNTNDHAPTASTPVM